jgi:hypothetical protein
MSPNPHVQITCLGNLSVSRKLLLGYIVYLATSRTKMTVELSILLEIARFLVLRSGDRDAKKSCDCFRIFAVFERAIEFGGLALNRSFSRGSMVIKEPMSFTLDHQHAVPWFVRI